MGWTHSAYVMVLLPGRSFTPPKLLDKPSLALLVDVAMRQSFGAVGWGMRPVEVLSVSAVSDDTTVATAVWHGVVKVARRCVCGCAQTYLYACVYVYVAV